MRHSPLVCDRRREPHGRPAPRAVHSPGGTRGGDVKDEPDPKGAAADEPAHAAVATPGALFRRPIALVLQAGSVAAAITSILGLVVIFAPGLVRGLSLGGGDGSAEREVTVEVSKGQEIERALRHRTPG